MNPKNNTKAPAYNSKLYATCQYMINNMNLFKDYSIYKLLECYENKKYLELHNCLINSFNFLTGKSTKKEKKGNSMGCNIMPSLELNKLPEKDIAMILIIFYEYTNTNHKATEQLFSVNVEKCVPLINALIKKINSNYIDDFKKIIYDSQSLNEREQLDENDYCKVLDRTYNLYREKIITECQNFLKKLDIIQYNIYTHSFKITPILDYELSFYCEIFFNDYSSSILQPSNLAFFDLPFAQNMRKLEKEYPYFRNLKKIYYAWLFCDLCCNSLLQYITRSFSLKDSGISIEDLDKLNSIILNLIQEYSVQSIEPYGTPEEILFYFSFYYYRRDFFLQDTNMLKYITEHCGKRENPKAEYNICQIKDTSLPIDEIQKLFTEGIEVRRETFQKNYELCIDGIDKYNKKAHRRIINDWVSQKAFYREIFLDKTLYTKNRRKSHRIFSDFCKSDVINLSDYYFLNEKINMGMYREYGQIDKFYAKNKFQENLYHLISLILSRLYPDKIQKITQKVFCKITIELKKILDV